MVWKVRLGGNGIKRMNIDIGIIGSVLFVGVIFSYNLSSSNVIIEEVILEEVAVSAEVVVNNTSAELELNIESFVEEEDEEEEIIEPTHDIDFDELKALNEDVYAWISVLGTTIEYPVLQHEKDDSYYLNYNIDGSYGYPGCIYTEQINSKTFRDYNTVLYGHNMKDGTMFTSLHQFKEEEFFEENKTIYIHTPQKTLEYHIFAAYIFDDRHIMHNFDFTSKSGFQSYLDTIFERNGSSDNIDRSIEVTADDKIITLVTCTSDVKTNRLLVQAVLVNN